MKTSTLPTIQNYSARATRQADACSFFATPDSSSSLSLLTQIRHADRKETQFSRTDSEKFEEATGRLLEKDDHGVVNSSHCGPLSVSQPRKRWPTCSLHMCPS